MALLNNSPQDYYQGNDFGNYQFVSLKDIINQFMIVYVGEDKIISKVKRMDVAFHAQRALAELSFDTFKSCKAQEITVPSTLQMTLPHDYVNYNKISYVDSSGIKHVLYPTTKTSNPQPIFQNDDNEYEIKVTATLTENESIITLDKQYLNIKKGMKISGPYMLGSSAGVFDQPKFVRNVNNTTSGGATTILLGESDNTNTFPTFMSGNITTPITVDLTISNADGSVILENEKNIVVENLYWFAGSNVINNVTASELSTIEVGMLVSNVDFPVGTTVLNVNTTAGQIIVSQNATDSIPSNATDSITFHSPPSDSTTWDNYKSQVPSENNNDDYKDDTYWPMNGERYGLDPQHAQANGSFYIDCVAGKIHFSSNISGKTVILDYISDSLGTEDEMQVHKFAEEAMYKWITYAVLSGKSNISEGLVARFKKERFAETRKAKLRLSNIKLEELTQILRGKSKWIKH